MNVKTGKEIIEKMFETINDEDVSERDKKRTMFLINNAQGTIVVPEKRYNQDQKNLKELQDINWSLLGETKNQREKLERIKTLVETDCGYCEMGFKSCEQFGKCDRFVSIVELRKLVVEE